MTTFVGPDLDSVEGLGALTLGGFCAEVTTRFAGNEAVAFDDPLLGGATVRWTYGDLGRETRRIARALIAAGIDSGNSVAVVMGNRPEALASILAAASIGAVAVPMSTFAPVPELVTMANAAAADVALTQSELLQRRFGEDLHAVAEQVPSLQQIVVLGDQSWPEFLAAGDQVPDSALDERAARVRPEDPGLVIFSSGTTSTPKGMLHTQRAPSLQMWVQARIFGRDETTRMWTALPLFWTAGFNTAVGATLAAGGCWVAQETFEPGASLALMERERVTEPYSLPHQTAALEEHPEWSGTDLSSLRCVYGKSAFARHPRVQGDPDWVMPVGYGLSEMCAFATAHHCDAGREAARRSVGSLVPGAQLRIIDVDSGEPLGVGEVGEIAVAGPMLMLGYLGRPTEESLDADGFFRTGDLGSIDELGELHFAGRRSEMIRTGGANVSPAELEVALRAFAPARLARVVGIADDRLDEIVVACVELKGGATATEDDVRGFLRERVSSYKVPKRVLFFDEGTIPMTASATKVRDEALIALVEQRLALERTTQR